MNRPDPLVIVPARGGSQRIPRKNLRPLGGLSLLGWTMASARAEGFAQVLLTTDSDEIAAEGERLGYWLPFRRPPELARDATPTRDTILHVLDWCRGTFGREPERILLLQPTSPFRPEGMIAQALRRFTDGVDAVVAMRRLHVSLGAVFTPDTDGLSPATRVGDVRAALVPSGALYLIRSEALREHGSFFPPRMAALEHDGPSTLDIDTPEDWALAEAMIAAGQVRVPPSSETETSRTRQREPAKH